jgi:Protein of unknown function (DUF664)
VDESADKRALTEFLDAQRAVVLDIVDGLTDEQLRTAVLPSGWTPLGLIEHLGHAERHWFQGVTLGVADPLPWPPEDEDDGVDDDGPGEDEENAGFTSDHPVAEVFAFYRQQIERSNAILGSTPLSTPPIGRHNGATPDDVPDLRFIVLHMIEETARHAGHLDVVRELLDGTTGRGER